MGCLSSLITSSTNERCVSMKVRRKGAEVLVKLYRGDDPSRLSSLLKREFLCGHTVSISVRDLQHIGVELDIGGHVFESDHPSMAHFTPEPMKHYSLYSCGCFDYYGLLFLQQLVAKEPIRLRCKPI